MKKFLVLLVSMILIVGFVFAVPTDEQIRQAANTLGVPFADLKQFVQSYQTQSAPSGVIKVDASTLITAYSGNRLQADSKYKDKTLQVTGKVDTVDQNSRGYYVQLAGDRVSWCDIRVFVKDSELSKIANLNKGDTVTLVGICSKGDSNYVDITEAYLTR